MNIVIIPARAGSKGIKNKNLINFAGKPLIYWSIRSAKMSKQVDEIYVSTDSQEIRKISESFGVKVLDRPKHLSEDDSKSIDVLKYHSKDFSELENFILLQPTSPLRPRGLIDMCLKAFKDSNFSNLATGYYIKNIEYGTHNNLRRQDIRGYFYDDGSVYILPKKLVENAKWCGINPLFYENKKQFSFEIDDLIDLKILEKLFEDYRKHI